MKPLNGAVTILLAIVAWVPAAQIPFSDFYASVQTNNFLTRGDKKTALSVTVAVGKFSEKREEQTRIEVNCFEFDAGIRRFDDADQQLFLQATSAAKDGKEFTATVSSPAIMPRQVQTMFESKQVDGRYVATVTRAKETAVFDPSEGERLLHALAEARAGEAWFRSLLADETLPTATEQMHPPRSHGYFVICRVGAVNCGRFSYEISLNCSSFREPLNYSVGHTVRFGNDHEESSSIGMGAEFFKHISEALEAVEQNRQYMFVPEDHRYKVEANRHSGQVDVTVARSDFFTDRSSLIGHIGSAQFEQIHAMISEASDREEWFKGHETLFFQREE